LLENRVNYIKMSYFDEYYENLCHVVRFMCQSWFFWKTFRSEKIKIKSRTLKNYKNRKYELKLKILIVVSSKSTNQDESFSKKSMFSTLKKKRSQKFVWGLPCRICSLDLKSCKKYWNIKSTNQNEHFPKKNIFSTSKG
jgi:hypothetical protein